MYMNVYNMFMYYLWLYNVYVLCKYTQPILIISEYPKKYLKLILKVNIIIIKHLKISLLISYINKPLTKGG